MCTVPLFVSCIPGMVWALATGVAASMTPKNTLAAVAATPLAPAHTRDSPSSTWGHMHTTLPEIRTRHPIQNPRDQRVDVNLKRREVLVVRVDVSDDDVHVVAQALADRDLGGGRLGLLFVNELGRIEAPAELPVLEDIDVGEDHSLVVVDFHASTDVLERHPRDVDALAGKKRRLTVRVPRLPGESDEHEQNPEVDDVSAISPARLGRQ